MPLDKSRGIGGVFLFSLFSPLGWPRGLYHDPKQAARSECLGDKMSETLSPPEGFNRTGWRIGHLAADAMRVYGVEIGKLRRK